MRFLRRWSRRRTRGCGGGRWRWAGSRAGIIASASYEARKFGVYTPMPTVRARKLCPRLVVLPGDYESTSSFRGGCLSMRFDFTPDVEQASIDEGYFDLSGCRRPAVEMAQTIRRAIEQSLQDYRERGDRQQQVGERGGVEAAEAVGLCGGAARGRRRTFCIRLPNKWLPGVGPNTAGRLQAAGLARDRAGGGHAGRAAGAAAGQDGAGGAAVCARDRRPSGGGGGRSAEVVRPAGDLRART